jgi:thioredoxin-dependent peroxiredoxin
MRMLKIAAAIAVAAAPAAALGALKEGAKAPDFTTTGAFAGKPYALRLKEQLRHGPLVLYFFPKSFTGGCNAEAHAFSEAAAEFKKAGAQVIGMSADDQPTLARFSTEMCQSAFPVATAAPATIQAYDVKLRDTGLTSRTSYVIAPNGKILYVYSDMDAAHHAPNTLAAVRAWKAKHPRG